MMGDVPQLLAFSAAGLRLGVFIGDVARLLAEDSVVAVPFAHPALAGLLDVPGEGPVPVFDLRGVDGTQLLPAVPGTMVAVFQTAHGPIGLRLDALHGTLSDDAPLPVDETRAMLAALPDALRPLVTGAALCGGTPLALFSPDAFMAQLGLLQRT